MKKKFLSILLIIIGLGTFRYVFTYKVTTHANLTSAIFDYYNKSFSSQQIPEEFKSLLIEGSRREDDPPRWLNHFYDPIYNRGLAWNKLSWESSKSWAKDDKTQLALVYKINLASVIGLGDEPLIFTWQKAIELYNKGDHKNAFLALGHILHLLEDVSVPDHTRNDAHMEGSPFEQFTNNLTPSMPSKKPFVLNNLDEYFDAMANYSNNNFYSKDTIGDKNYKSPEPDFIRRDGDYYFRFKVEDNDLYHLAVLSNFGDYKYVHNGVEIFSLEDINAKVLNDYWTRLSDKSIRYGAGVIDLFFKEAEKDKARSTDSAGSLKASSLPVAHAENKNFLASALDAFKSLITNSTTDSFEEVAVLDLEKKTVEIKKDEKNIRTSDVQNIDANLRTSDVVTPPSPEAKVCVWQDPSQSSGRQPLHTPLIINEVNWQGSETSTSDEWIELKNISASQVDISGWQLISQGGNLKLKLSGKVSAGNFTVLRRGADYKGALKNSADGLRLFDNQCNFLDEVLAAPNWPAGENPSAGSGPRRSAERSTDLLALSLPNGSWHNGNLSSPGAENSPSASSGQASPSIGSSSGGSVSSLPAVALAKEGVSNPAPAATSTPASVPAPAASSTPAPLSNVLISEFLFDAEGADNEKEFIELYNSNSAPVDISSWSIQHKSASSSSTTKKNFEAGSAIAPKSFFLIWLGADSRGDLKWLSGSLNNTAATISLVNGAEVIDSVSYSKDGLFAPVGQGLERKALQDGRCVSAQQAGEFLGNGCDSNQATDWEIRPIPNPQNKSSLVEPRDPPVAVENFRADFSSATMELILNWSSPSSTAPTYLIANNFGYATSTSATSTKISINEIGQEYKFTIQNFDKDNLASAPTESSITPKFLNNLYFYSNPSSSENFIEIKTNSYPFIPDLFALGNRWKELVFYLNGDLENPLMIQYENCYNQVGDHSSLILPDDQMRCTNDGGMYGEGLNFKYIEDNNFVIRISNPSSTFSPSDYITVAYKSTHSTAPWDGRIVYLQPVATDAQKYYFQEVSPPHQPPQLSGDIEIEYREDESLIIVRWPKATDLDTPDFLLTYEIKYQNDDQWQDIKNSNMDIKRLSDGDPNFNISVRARDPFGNYSNVIKKAIAVGDRSVSN